jgi:glycosyltransferase 2 family protein
MYAKLRRWWPVVKSLFLLALIFFIGRLVYTDLTRPDLDLQAHAPHPGWLLLAGVLYLLWFTGSTAYWRALLASFHRRPPLLATIRAYYVGQLGKYVPGKAWALLVRANLIYPFGVGRGLATLTAFYEVLTTMASGSLFALVLLALFGTDSPQPLTWQMLKLEVPAGAAVDRKVSVLLCASFLCVYGGPILPPLFNWVVHHVSLPFRDKAAPVPRIRMTVLLKGIALTLTGWAFLGCSLLAVVRAVCGPDLPWSPAMAGRVLGLMALAWFGGFIFLPAPGGIGAREYLIVLFLTPELRQATNGNDDMATALALVVAVVMRLLTVAAELLASACLYWLPVKPAAGAAAPDAVDPAIPAGEAP